MKSNSAAEKSLGNATKGRGVVIMGFGVAVYFLGGLIHHYIALFGWLIGIIGFGVFAKSVFSPKLHQAELDNLKEKQPWEL